MKSTSVQNPNKQGGREKPMPMCPFCNRETTYVVPVGDIYHCFNCGGDFDQTGEPVMPPDQDDFEDWHPNSHADDGGR